MNNRAWKRIGSGLYELNGYRIDGNVEGMVGFWFLAYPGEMGADDVYSTLREAKADAVHHMEEVS